MREKENKNVMQYQRNFFLLFSHFLSFSPTLANVNDKTWWSSFSIRHQKLLNQLKRFLKLLQSATQHRWTIAVLELFGDKCFSLLFTFCVDFKMFWGSFHHFEPFFSYESWWCGKLSLASFPPLTKFFGWFSFMKKVLWEIVDSLDMRKRRERTMRIVQQNVVSIITCSKLFFSLLVDIMSSGASPKDLESHGMGLNGIIWKRWLGKEKKGLNLKKVH